MENARTSVARRWAPLLMGVPTLVGLSVAGAGVSGAAVAAKQHARGEVTVHETLVVVDGGMTGHPDDPEIVGGTKVQFPANAKVDLTIYNFDSGPAPLAKGLPYDKVMGTVGGTATYDGKTITKVSNSVISHTFTVPGIGLNVPLPAAQETKKGAITPAVVTASFVTNKKGTFTWQCYAPCGSGKDGNGGAMQDPGEMTGKVVIG